MKYKNIKELSHGFCKKYKILQKLVYIMIAMNWFTLWSPCTVTSEFNIVPQYGSSVI